MESPKEVNRKYSSNEIYLNSFLAGTTRLEDKNTPGIWVKVTVTKSVWFKGKEKYCLTDKMLVSKQEA